MTTNYSLRLAKCELKFAVFLSWRGASGVPSKRGHLFQPVVFAGRSRWGSLFCFNYRGFPSVLPKVEPAFVSSAFVDQMTTHRSVAHAPYCSCWKCWVSVLHGATHLFIKKICRGFIQELDTSLGSGAARLWFADVNSESLDIS